MLEKISVENAFMRANFHAKKGEVAEAKKLYQEVLRVFPKNKKAREKLTALNMHKYNDVNQIISQATINQLVYLYEKGKFLSVIEQAQSLTEKYPDAFVVWNILGASTAKMGMFKRAVVAYKTCILLEPNFAAAHNNMGTALKAQGKLDEAIEAYKKSILLKPDYVDAYNNLGAALRDKGKMNEAIEVYNKALSLEPNYVSFNNMGNALKDQGKLDEAIDAYKNSISLKSDYAFAYNNLATVLKKQDKLEDSLVFYNKAILLKPDFAEAYTNKGNILNDQGEIEEAINNFKHALKINPNYEKARVNKLFSQAEICDWSDLDEDRQLIPKIGISHQHINPVLMTTFEDKPERHRIRSEIYAKNIIKQKTMPMPLVPNNKPKRLRIGYFSSDFRVHSVIHMISNILETHDRQNFEIYAYSFGPNDGSDIRQRIINTVDVFHDVKEMTDKDITLLARENKIDIAIDLNGYTKYCRPDIFAYRCAPIQIHFWGSGSSCGASFIDYIITTEMAVPKEHNHHYCESIIRLPFWFQARHKNNYISERSLTRKDVGLPAHGFVFCSFNNNYKLSPNEFEIWMRLLNKVKHSVLWIYKSNKWVEKNLLEEASKRGVSKDRLVFAEQVQHDVHLERLKLADLFVDTFNVTAGATAGDALWSGLPLVTKLGKSQHARGSGYILASIEMHELITETEKEYEALLLDLATNPQRLSRIKAKLEAKRSSAPLFNLELFTKHLEKGFQEAYQLYFDGKSPENISVF